MAENGRALRTLAAGGRSPSLWHGARDRGERTSSASSIRWRSRPPGRSCLFPLADLANDALRFGDQVVVNEKDGVHFERRLLSCGVSDARRGVRGVHARGNLAIAAHVDRPAHSVVSQLGFLPQGVRLDAVELTRHATEGFVATHAHWLRGLAAVRFSDAHFLHDVGAQRTYFRIEAPTVSEIALALRGEAGREVAGYA